eukprot:Sspe_Gene.46101::Locus_22946_Transcript_1_1_Confidence_1.000_Length_933::g.46101::m.46101
MRGAAIGCCYKAKKRHIHTHRSQEGSHHPTCSGELATYKKRTAISCAMPLASVGPSSLPSHNPTPTHAFVPRVTVGAPQGPSSDPLPPLSPPSPLVHTFLLH